MERLNSKFFQPMEIAVAILATAIFYGVKVEIIPSASYIIPAVLFGIYLFPLRILLSEYFIRASKKNKTIYALSTITLALTILASITATIFPSNVFTSTLSYTVSIGNLFFLGYYYIATDINHFRRLHFCFVWITSAILFL